MPSKTDLPTPDGNDTVIALGVLSAIEEDSNVTQRRLANDLGIAVGLANTYFKRAVNKGFVKVSQAPARRYAYYLTPKGFAEKSRLTAEYLSQSFKLFRRARAEYASLLATCERQGWRRVALMGDGDLAEIVAICALDTDVELCGVIDEGVDADAVVLCDLEDPQGAYEDACRNMPQERVLAPAFLHVSPRPRARGRRSAARAR